MVQFFTVQDGSLVVSPSIIVYWEFALPITIVVFVFWWIIRIWRPKLNARQPPPPPPPDYSLSRMTSRSSQPPGSSTRLALFRRCGFRTQEPGHGWERRRGILEEAGGEARSRTESPWLRSVRHWWKDQEAQVSISSEVEIVPVDKLEV
jgi:hypothetical protein